MNRRGFLKSILATGVAPYVVTAAGVLMPVRSLWTPTNPLFTGDVGRYNTTILLGAHNFRAGDYLTLDPGKELVQVRDTWLGGVTVLRGVAGTALSTAAPPARASLLPRPAGA